ncbi:MAG: response regulator [Myxococcales bacterium]|nr:response regulator [Myxococcales bacterium]
MLALLRPPTLGDEDATRKGRLILSILWTMFALGAMGFTTSVLDARNDMRVTAAFYLSIFAALGGLAVLVHRGRVVLAAWAVSIFFWLVIAVVTLFFGGMQGQNASTFAVSVLLIGVVVGGRAAVWTAFVSSAWCGVVAALEIGEQLPEQLAGYRPLNAWTAATITLVLTSVLLRGALESLEAMNRREQAAARERDEALRRSIHSQKLEIVGTLTAGVAHDFNNLLTVIGSASAVLRERVAHDAETSAVFDDLDTATSRAALMTRQLLAFGRAPADEAVPVDLGEFLRASVAMLPRLLGSPIKLQIEAAAACRVLAAPAGLEQIILNLAVNARDAMPAGGTLRLVVSATDGEVELTATDTGVGMDEDTRARIFEPFFTTKNTGTGLGLATVRELVTRFGGTIAVESASGRGATFILRFPRISSEVGPVRGRSRRAPEVTEHALRRVLLVEDDRLVRRSSTRLLEREGFEVIAVADGEEALAFLASAPEVACVVSDVSMPRMDGETLARELAVRRPDLPVLLVSGNHEPTPPVPGGPRRGFLDKPFDGVKLRAAIEALLQG